MRRLGTALLVIGLLACRQTALERYEDEVGRAEPAARHAVQSERLRRLMRDIVMLSSERLPKEMDLAAETERRTRSLAETAAELAVTAGQIPEVLVGVELPEPHRSEFLALADQLRSRALALSRDAPGLSVSAMRERLDALTATCDACHGRFRVLPRVGAQP